MTEPIAQKMAMSVSIKSAEKGQAVVRFATADGKTVDLDGDITGPDAFTEGAQCPVSPWGHRCLTDGVIPAGIATIHKNATADVQCFLDTGPGKETFRTVNGLGPIVQYSYGYGILEEGELSAAMRAAGARRYLKRLDVWELSPVVRGAGGPATRTLAVKACGCGAGSTCGCAPAETEAKRFARIIERHAVPPGLPLPARFADAIKFAAGQLCIPSSAMPAVKAVAVSALPDGATAQYLRDRDEILIRADLDDDETLAALFHEFAHVYEKSRHWETDEVFAEGQEARLLAKWNTNQGGN